MVEPAQDRRHTRVLRWDGCLNVRDLGGLSTAAGQTLRRGALVRSDSPHRLTSAGWAAAWAHGIRTVIDLRHAHERDTSPDRFPRPSGITTLHVPLEDIDDADFLRRWGPQITTPHYYADAFDRFADRHATLIRSMATAPPGGILVHCAIGRDRTGQATLLLLALLGVAATAIADDHALSAPAVAPIDPHHDLLGPLTPARAAEYRAAILTHLATWDPTAYALAAGATTADLAALRARLLTPLEAPPPPAA